MSCFSLRCSLAIALGVTAAQACRVWSDEANTAAQPAAPAAAIDGSQPTTPPTTQNPPEAQSPANESPLADRFDAKVLHALAHRVTIDASEPLERLAPYLRDAFDVPVYFDRDAVEEAEIDPQAKISLRAVDQPLENALEIALAPLDMTIDVSAGRLVVTTVEAAKINVTPRIHRVDHLRPPLDEQARATATHPDIDSLRDVVVRFAHPQSWDDVGGPAVYREFGDLLVISQSRRGHRRVDAMLAALAEAFARHEQNLDDARPIDVTPGTTKQLAALDGVATVRFNNVPLSEAVETLHETLGVTLWIDEARLAEFDIWPHTAVTVDRTAAPLRAVLADMLAPLGLTFVVDRGELVITPAEAIDRCLTVRLYPVADLVRPYLDPQPSPRETYLQRYRFDELNTDDGQPSRQPTDFDPVVELFVSTIAPESWDTVGGPGLVVEYEPAKCLAVANTLEVHRRIERLLAGLREMRGQQEQAPSKKNANAPGVTLAADEDTWRLEVFRIVTPPVVASPPQANDAKQANAAPSQPTATKANFATGIEKELAEMIPQVIEPATWSDSQAYIRGIPDAIVVRHKHGVLRQIAALMDRLELFGPPLPRGRQVPFVTGAGVVVGDGAPF